MARPTKDAGQRKDTPVTTYLPPEIKENFATYAARRNSSMSELISDWILSIVKENPAEADLAGTPVPVLGKIRCGDEGEYAPFPEGTTITPPWPVTQGYYALLATGDSMNGPNEDKAVKDGDIVFFKKGDSETPGDTVHVEWNENGIQYATLKTLTYRDNGERFLKPLNPDFDILVPRDYEIRGTRVGRILRPVAPVAADDEELEAESDARLRFGKAAALSVVERARQMDAEAAPKTVKRRRQSA